MARFIDPEQRAELLGQLEALGSMIVRVTPVTDCRDSKDNKYLELALAAGAPKIVTSDSDLLVLDPWRSVRIMRPAASIAQADESG